MAKARHGEWRGLLHLSGEKYISADPWPYYWNLDIWYEKGRLYMRLNESTMLHCAKAFLGGGWLQQPLELSLCLESRVVRPKDTHFTFFLPLTFLLALHSRILFRVFREPCVVPGMEPRSWHSQVRVWRHLQCQRKKWSCCVIYNSISISVPQITISMWLFSF